MQDVGGGRDDGSSIVCGGGVSGENAAEMTGGNKNVGVEGGPQRPHSTLRFTLLLAGQ